MTDENNFDIYEDVRVDVDRTSGSKSGHGEDSENFSLYDDLAGTEEPYKDNRLERSLSPEQHTPKSDQDNEASNSDQTAVYIGNLTWWTTDQDLETIFSEFGKVKNIKFFEDKVNGKSKGYALIEFGNSEAAYQAKEKLNGIEIQGKPVVVNYVNPENLKQLTRSSAPTGTRPQGERRGGESYKGREGSRGGYRGSRGGPNFANPLEMMARSGFFRGRGMPVPVADPRLLGMPMAHVNPAFLPKPEGDYRSREDYYREREREDRERERDRERDRERERERERDRKRDRDDKYRDDRKRSKEDSRHHERDRKH